MADLARDMLAGAQLVNMGWQRQERMMQLRAQAAAQQMQERQIAAQAQMLTEHARLYRIQADQEEQDAKDQAAVTKAAADHFDYLYNDLQLDKDEAAQTSILAASVVHPVAGEKMAKAYTELKRATSQQELPANVRTARELGTIKTKLDTLNNSMLESGIGEGSAELEAKRAEIANLQAQYDYLQSSGTGRGVKKNATSEELLADAITESKDALTLAKQGGNPDEIAKAQEAWDNLNRAILVKHPDRKQILKGQILKEHETMAYKALLENPTDAGLNRMYRKAREELEAYESNVLAPAPSSSEKIKAGTRVKVKSPDGKIGTLPVEQLKEALANGWTRLE